jgi:hypothetical protein
MIDSIVFWAGAAGVLGLLAIFFPKVFIGIVMFFALAAAMGNIASPMERDQSKRVKKAVKGRFPDVSEEHQKAIVDRVLSGANIENFCVENDVLWIVLDGKKNYWRSSGRWADKPKSTDVGDLYAEHRLEIEQDYPDCGLKSQDIHDLSIQMYFNWRITSITSARKVIVVKLTRRGKYRRLVFPAKWTE